MKMFNWVQRRFHHNFHHSNISLKKDEIVQDVKKRESTGAKDMLENFAYVDVFDSWKDGILTIGTLGFNPFKSEAFNQQQKHYMLMEKEEDQDSKEEEEEYSFVNSEEENTEVEDEEELKPLMSTSFESKFDGILKPDKGNLPLREDGITLSPQVSSFHDDEGKTKKKGERITLADLFSADSRDVKRQPNPNKVKSESANNKPDPVTNNSFPFAKKHIHECQDAHPVKKLNQLIKRMLKKKIHPEIGTKIQKMGSQIMHSSSEFSTIHVLPPNETKSLL